MGTNYIFFTVLYFVVDIKKFIKWKFLILVTDLLKIFTLSIPAQYFFSFLIIFHLEEN